jgi:uncharacterized protein (TIGR00730 family)
MIESVCVYCASSNRSPEIYLDAAARLGRILAENGITIVYGGSSLGSMGRLAAAALEAGGKVIGVLPRFMDDLEWGHRALSELRIVEDMHERKRVMLELSGAAIALPGGCGTLEELFEAITWKRLGLYFGPVVLVNVGGFFDPCIELLNRCVDGAVHGREASRDVERGGGSGERDGDSAVGWGMEQGRAGFRGVAVGCSGGGMLTEGASR